MLMKSQNALVMKGQNAFCRGSYIGPTSSRKGNSPNKLLYNVIIVT